MEKWHELIIFIDCISNFNNPVSRKFFKGVRNFELSNEDSSIVVSIRDCGSCDPSSILGYPPINFIEVGK